MNSDSIKNLLSDYAVPNPGCAVVIVESGIPVFTFCAGFADLEQKIPVTPETNFRLASISKQFTASAVMLLAQQERILLDDPLEIFFKSVPHYARKVTIAELLSHTSGILDYEDLLGHFRKQIHDEEVLDLELNQNHGYFDPGKSYRYSNGGYCILEIIVEKISGFPFWKFMRQNFFDPLRMDATIIDIESETIVRNRAFGYSRIIDSWTKTDEDQTSATIGDGGVYSSINDMVKWNDSLDQGTMLSKETISQIFERKVLTDEDDGQTYYGFGFFLKDHGGEQVQFHGGSSIGFRAGIYRVPAKNVAAVFLSNRNEGEGSVIVEKIIDSFLEELLK